jgi:hypothetical protein
MFAYKDFIICFISTDIKQPHWFLGYLKLYENIIQYFPARQIIGLLEVYQQLVNPVTVLPFFLQYLTNAENMLSG